MALTRMLRVPRFRRLVLMSVAVGLSFMATATQARSEPTSGAARLAAIERAATLSLRPVSAERAGRASDGAFAYPDAVGDSPLAPDIGEIVVSHVGSALVFQVGVANLGPGLVDGEFLSFALDVDRNPGTGCGGREVSLAVLGRLGPDFAALGRCVGSEWNFGVSQGAFSYSYVAGAGLSGPGTITFRVSTGDVGATAFTFDVGSSYEGISQTYFDLAGPFVFVSPTSVPPAPAPPAVPTPTPTPPPASPQPVVTIFKPLPTLPGPTSASRVDSRYSRAATAIADTTAVAKCWSASDWNSLHESRVEFEGGDGLSFVLGFFKPGTNILNLAPEVCARLDLLSYRKKRPTTLNSKRALANAVTTLAHEAVHLLGVEDEAVTECYAMQLTEVVAHRLGVARTYGYSLGRIVWLHDWPAQRGTEYWTADCYNGGPLDLFPKIKAWP